MQVWSRAEIFVKEQNITYVDEENIDFDSLHFFCMDEDRAVAYLRAYQKEPGVVKVGRVLSLEHGKGLGSELMKFAISEIPQKTGCKKIHIGAQKHAAGFYERFGFKIPSDQSA